MTLLRVSPSLFHVFLCSAFQVVSNTMVVLGTTQCGMVGNKENDQDEVTMVWESPSDVVFLREVKKKGSPKAKSEPDVVYVKTIQRGRARANTRGRGFVFFPLFSLIIGVLFALSIFKMPLSVNVPFEWIA